jgi:uncharacterized protein (TIGR04255 family)
MLVKTLNNPMEEDPLHLKNAPIIESILDIDCELAPGFELSAAEEEIRAAIQDHYPKMRHTVLQEHQFSQNAESAPELTIRQGLQAIQFLTDEEKQIVQFRTGGFSFNRLAPYSGFDDYLPEIERTWGLFQNLAKPVTIRKIGLRTINRILLPLADGKVRLEEYLQTCPRLPDEERLCFTGFLNHHAAEEIGTGNRVHIVLTTQDAEPAALPLILDIDAFRPCRIEPPPWAVIVEILASLRELKNRVFRHTLTPKCLSLF